MPRSGRIAAGGAVTEERDADAVHARQPEVAERGRGPPRRIELVRLAVVHAAARVDEDVDGDVLLLDEELHEEALEPRVGVPVELAQVVAGGVVAVVGELDALAAPHAAPLALHPPGGEAPRGQLELLEPAQEGLVEERCALGGGHRSLLRPADRRTTRGRHATRPVRWASRR